MPLDLNTALLNQGPLPWGPRTDTEEITAVAQLLNVFATTILVQTGQPQNRDSITLGQITYIYQNALTGGAHDVKIGATSEITGDNLVAAINFAAGKGTLYGRNTPAAHPEVSAAPSGGDDDVDFTARFPGVAGNAIFVSENHNLGTIAAFSGGVDAKGVAVPEDCYQVTIAHDEANTVPLRISPDGLNDSAGIPLSLEQGYITLGVGRDSKVYLFSEGAGTQIVHVIRYYG